MKVIKVLKATRIIPTTNSNNIYYYDPPIELAKDNPALYSKYWMAIPPVTVAYSEDQAINWIDFIDKDPEFEFSIFGLLVI